MWYIHGLLPIVGFPESNLWIFIEGMNLWNILSFWEAVKMMSGWKTGIIQKLFHVVSSSFCPFKYDLNNSHRGPWGEALLVSVLCICMSCMTWPSMQKWQPQLSGDLHSRLDFRDYLDEKAQQMIIGYLYEFLLTWFAVYMYHDYISWYTFFNVNLRSEFVSVCLYEH